MILLVTGGSASGKSEYAENRALQLAKTEQKKLIYLAAMKPLGEEAPLAPGCPTARPRRVLPQALSSATKRNSP